MVPFLRCKTKSSLPSELSAPAAPGLWVQVPNTASKQPRGSRRPRKPRAGRAIPTAPTSRPRNPATPSTITRQVHPTQSILQACPGPSRLPPGHTTASAQRVDAIHTSSRHNDRMAPKSQRPSSCSSPQSTRGRRNAARARTVSLHAPSAFCPKGPFRRWYQFDAVPEHSRYALYTHCLFCVRSCAACPSRVCFDVRSAERSYSRQGKGARVYWSGWIDGCGWWDACICLAVRLGVCESGGTGAPVAG